MMPNRTDDLEGLFEGEGEDEMFSQHRERGAQDRWQRPRVVSEFVKRAIENTVGSVQNTSSLSREALQYLLQQGDRGKKELVRIVGQEVGEFLRNVDLSSELVKILTSVQVELNASVRFKRTADGSVKPEIAQNAEVLQTKDIPSVPEPKAGPEEREETAPKPPATEGTP